MTHPGDHHRVPTEDGHEPEDFVDVWEPLSKTLELLDRRLEALLPETPSAAQRRDLLRLRRLTADTLQRLHDLTRTADRAERAGIAGADVGAQLRRVGERYTSASGIDVHVRVRPRARPVAHAVVGVLARVLDDGLDVLLRFGRGAAVEVVFDVSGSRAVLEVREMGLAARGTGVHRDVSGDRDVARMAHALQRFGGRVVVQAGGACGMRIRAVVPLAEWSAGGARP